MCRQTNVARNFAYTVCFDPEAASFPAGTGNAGLHGCLSVHCIQLSPHCNYDVAPPAAKRLNSREAEHLNFPGQLRHLQYGLCNYGRYCQYRIVNFVSGRYQKE